MKRHRVFIAINLPENIRQELMNFQLKWPELPVRWTKKDNLHITLAFLGYVREEELVDILSLVKEIVSKYQPFHLKLKRIVYGPPNNKKSPRMIWAEGEKSQELGRLQEDLKNNLLGFSSELKKEAKKIYIPHITLGRLRQWEFRAIELEERPEINEEIDLNFEVNSVEVMESRLKRGGSQYTILESVYLSK